MRVLTLLAFALAFPFITHAQLPVVQTVAGNGINEYGSDGVKATNSNLTSFIGKMAVGPDNTLYICDSNRLRKVDPISRKIYTVAGSGVQSSTGDGSWAEFATFMSVTAVTVAANGDIYIADNIANRVRKIEAATMLISTVAGNGDEAYNGDNIPAVNAAVGHPHALALDKAGNLYINSYARVRRVDAITGIITTYAGNGVVLGPVVEGTPAVDNALGPTGLTIDTADNLYISTFFDKIVKVDPATGLISIIFGNGNSQGDGGPAIDGHATGAIYDMKADKHGNLFFPEYDGSNRIRVIDANGMVHTVAGNGTYGYNGEHVVATNAHIAGPTGMTVDTCGNVLFTDYNHRVRLVNLGYCTSSLGVGEVAAGASSFSVYPNPASSELTVSSSAKISSVAIMDVTGRTVLQRTVNSEQITVDVSGLVSGVYFVKVALRQAQVESKVVKFVKE